MTTILEAGCWALDAGIWHPHTVLIAMIVRLLRKKSMTMHLHSESAICFLSQHFPQHL